jgi:hypothetical protein
MAPDVQLAEPVSKVMLSRYAPRRMGRGREGVFVRMAYVRISGNQYYLSKYITILINKYIL